MKSVLFTLVLVFSASTWATEDQVSFANQQQEQLYKELLKELRCPKCQNQNIADSNAVVAKDMRVKTKQLVDQGQSKQQVIDYMVNRYGQFAHYQPPLNIATSMLWVLPIGFVALALLFLLRRSRKPVVIEGQEIRPNQDADLDRELAELMSQEGKNK